jgi:predicted ATP-dependent endonuclease of OLD family
VKLIAVRVRMFRNILDSTEVKIESKVTCLVGKNESGKSAFLNALWRLKPARRSATFSVPDQYPAWLEKRHRNEGIDQSKVQPIDVDLEWEPADVRVLEEKFGPGVVKTGTKLNLSKCYDNTYRWQSDCDEHQAVKNFVEQQELPSPDTYSAIQKFEALAVKLGEDTAKNADVPEALKKLTNAQTALKTLLGKH